MTEIRVRVLPGNIVYRGNRQFRPGDDLTIDGAELDRLYGVVEKTATNDTGKTGEESDLVNAIAALDPDTGNELVWTKTGKPQTSALAELLGRPVSAKERDGAWAVYNRDGA